MAIRRRKSKPKPCAVQVAQIREALGHSPFTPPPPSFLDTGSSDLNSVLGRRDRGIPYGILVELFGNSSLGKTALGLDLVAKAQKDGALVWWVDLENSWDPEWAESRGVDVDNVFLFDQYLGTFKVKVKGGSTKVPRLASIKEVSKEVEELLKIQRTINPEARFFGVIDSLAAVITDLESVSGLDGSMHTDMATPKFIGKWLRRWVSLCKAHSSTALLINQVRTNPTKIFGDPSYTPGGAAPTFYSHVRARLTKLKKGRVVHNNKKVGIVSIITNIKSKLGPEGNTCGYQMMFSGSHKFMSEKIVRRRLGKENAAKDE